MSRSAADLPEDPAELRRFAAALAAEVHAKTLLIEKLRMQLSILRRARFGRSSEKLDREIEQLELLLGEIEENDAERQARTEASDDQASSTLPSKKPSVRKPLPDHLPLETVMHEAPCICPTCGATKFGRIGVDERMILEYVPSHFKRVLHVRPKMSCRACEWKSTAPSWRAGSVIWRRSWSPWLSGSRVMCAPAPRSMPTIRRFPCSIPAVAERKPADCGPR
jgi:transposase